jgi:hypothetical protein
MRICLAIALVVLMTAVIVWGGQSDLPNCDEHLCYSGSGTVCRTIDVTNDSSDPNSSQTITCRYQNGNVDTISLTKGQSTTFDSEIRSIFAHETGCPNGHVTWTIH